MRRLFLGLAVVLGLSALAPTSHAQIQNNFNDPFFLYYGWYLPRQAALSAQPSVTDTINANAANRQANAEAERDGLYNPVDPFGLEELDPSRPFRRQQGRARVIQHAPNGHYNSNLRGAGPPTHYNRVAGYYPTLKPGRGPNSNLSVNRKPRSAGGYGGGFY